MQDERFTGMVCIDEPGNKDFTRSIDNFCRRVHRFENLRGFPKIGDPAILNQQCDLAGSILLIAREDKSILNYFY